MHKNIVEVIHSTFRKYPLKTAYSWRENKEIKSVTYSEVADAVKKISAALINIGVKQGDRVGLIADVSYYWILGNLSIQNIGAVDVPRGTDSTGQELAYILSHSGCGVVMAQNADQISKIESCLKSEKKYKVKKYIVLSGALEEKASARIVALEDILKNNSEILKRGSGKKAINFDRELELRHKELDRDSVASIIYTSGTTGQPKGVMLTQGNLVSQINLLPGPFELSSGDRMLTLLPPWHVFGRVLEYLFFEAGASINYTDVKNLGDDLKRIKPTYMPAVPRVLEGIYNKIMANVKKGGKENIFNIFKNISLFHYRCLKIVLGQERRFLPRNPIVNIALKFFCFIAIGLLTPLKIVGHFLVFRKIIAATGGKLRGSISGGGALPEYIDEFFAATGIHIYEGYGLTETSPVLAVRLPGRIIPGTVGPPAPMTQIRIISLEGRDVTNIPGAKGTLFVRGPQVMKGYYKDDKKTKSVLDSSGWLNTGDLVQITVTGEISIVGRSKDTIVLRGGENVEPVPIEEKLLESPYIDNLMLTGQDQKSISALIVPSMEAVNDYCQKHQLPHKSLEDCANDPLVHNLISKEIGRLNNSASGFKVYERVTKFKILSKPFEVGDEMSQTFKVKRFVVTEKYAQLIKEMYVGEK
ncbi:MAG: AMP-binding protein [Spirochaetia bacterium]|nr:AMP-binding protein [Spirochaetia bacterium]